MRLIRPLLAPGAIASATALVTAFAIALAIASVCGDAQAHVTGLRTLSVKPAFEGRVFGDVGAYLNLGAVNNIPTRAAEAGDGFLMNQVCNVYDGYVALPRQPSADDSCEALSTRYPQQLPGYLARVDGAVTGLVKAGYMLDSDRRLVLDQARKDGAAAFAGK